MDLINEIRNECITAACRAYARGIQTGNGGNFSARIPGEDKMIVKPSGGSFVDVSADNLLICNFDGELISGNGKPTREALLHGLIYKIAPGVNGVMHCHAPWSIAWAATGKNLEDVTLHQRLKFPGAIRVVDIKTPVVEKNDFPKIEAIFENGCAIPGFLLASHGMVAIGGSIIEAEHNAEFIEETATIAALRMMLLGRYA
ncbi:MAG: class II aldolase/adducin family protein [Bacillota bacterium]